METIISLRAFDVRDPATTETSGLLGETENGDWEYQHETGEPFKQFFERYAADELGDLDAVQPAPQRVYNDVVVILDELLFRVVDDGIECEYRLSNGSDLADGQTICSDRTDAEIGGAAERRHTGERIADAVQRTADALDHRIAWLDVISPRSLGPVAEAAEELLDDGD